MFLVAAAEHEVQARTKRSFAVDATVGGAKGWGGEFYDRGIAGARVAFSVRGSQGMQVAPFAEVAMEWLSVGTAHDAVCYLNSEGRCLDSYPAFAGPEITMGLIVGLQRRMEFRGGIGGGAYRANGPRVGGLLGQLDAALFPLQRLGVVAGAKAVVVPRYRGDRLWTIPWALGLRVR